MEEVAAQLEAIVKELHSIANALGFCGGMLIALLVCIGIKEFGVVIHNSAKEEDEPPNEFGRPEQ